MFTFRYTCANNSDPCGGVNVPAYDVQKFCQVIYVQFRFSFIFQFDVVYIFYMYYNYLFYIFNYYRPTIYFIQTMLIIWNNNDCSYICMSAYSCFMFLHKQCTYCINLSHYGKKRRKKTLYRFYFYITLVCNC